MTGTNVLRKCVSSLKETFQHAIGGAKGTWEDVASTRFCLGLAWLGSVFRVEENEALYRFRRCQRNFRQSEKLVMSTIVVTCKYVSSQNPELFPRKHVGIS